MSRIYNSKSGVTLWEGLPTKNDIKSDGQNYVYFLPKNEPNEMCVKPYCGIVEVWQKVTHKTKFLGMTIGQKITVDIIAVFKIKLKYTDERIVKRNRRTFS